MLHSFFLKRAQTIDAQYPNLQKCNFMLGFEFRNMLVSSIIKDHHPTQMNSLIFFKTSTTH